MRFDKFWVGRRIDKAYDILFEVFELNRDCEEIACMNRDGERYLIENRIKTRELLDIINNIDTIMGR
jgi:hypothetical protein